MENGRSRQGALEPVVLVCRLPTDEDAPGAARNFVAQMLGELNGAADHRGDDLALVVSEMVSNAVLHGPPGEVELRLRATNEVVRMEVCDRGVEPFSAQRDLNGDGHWGLGLCAEFSDRFAIERTPWTQVWCEFDLNGTDSLTRNGNRDR